MQTARSRPPGGFTLLQLIASIAIIAVLAAASIKAFGIARRGAMASACGHKLKAVAMDLERYRSDFRCYPTSLGELYPEYTKSEDAFHCPEDDRRGVYTYEDFYVTRWAKEKGEDRLLIACPFHQDAGRGVELFYSDTGSHVRGQLCVATLSSSGGGVSILPYDADRPSDAEPTEDAFWGKAVAAVPNMDVGPGDWLRVASGAATLTFKDQSRAEITGPTEIMVVDAFRTTLESKSVVYSVLRLARGTVFNIVTPGSKYEVVTPTGTAGAKGTQFTVLYKPTAQVQAPSNPGKGKGKKKPKGVAEVTVTTGTVYLTGLYGEIELGPGESGDAPDNGNPVKKPKKPKP